MSETDAGEARPIGRGPIGNAKRQQRLAQWVLAGRFAWIGLMFLSGMDSAVGGAISFDVDATNQIVTVTNTGDSAAYDASVFALQTGGEWLPLAVAGKFTVQWSPQEKFSFVLPPQRDTRHASSLASLRALIVCFFDQAGVEFSQVAFLNPPSRSDDLVDAGYRSDKLYIRVPEKQRQIAATWILWTREEGIRSIIAPLKLQHAPPRSKYIRWADPRLDVEEIDTGADLPAVYLVHKVVTSRGSKLVLQVVPAGKTGGEEQRNIWLSQGPVLFCIGGALLAAGFVLLLIPAVITLRKRRQRQ